MTKLERILLNPIVVILLLIFLLFAIIDQAKEDRMLIERANAQTIELDGCGHPGWEGGINSNCK